MVTQKINIKQSLLRPADACVYLGISRASLYRLSANDPTFPRKIIMTSRLVGYRVEALAEWLLKKQNS